MNDENKDGYKQNQIESQNVVWLITHLWVLTNQTSNVLVYKLQ